MFGKDKKKRSRRVNTKYGQKTLKHARKGIQSCMMAVLCAVTTKYFDITNVLSLK